MRRHATLQYSVRTLAVAALVGATLAGCAIERPARSEAEMREHRAKFVQERLAARIELSRHTVTRMLAEQEAAAQHPGEGPPVFDILILSGGGDYGAFGAGVLKGWGTITDPGYARPVFDVVSGVSTGALIAPLAFAGTEDAYERAFQVYQNPKPDWFKERWLIDFLLRKESFVDNAGLKRDVKATLDKPIIEAIARANAENRSLIIGTTNLDMGMITMWDAGDEAAKVANQGVDSERFYNIILASTSIPGAFPPVEIDGDLHVDGGVTRNIAYTTDQDFAHSAVNMWKREQRERKASKIRFWVIVNNQLATPCNCVQPGWPNLMTRSLEMAIRASTLGSLKALQLSMELARVQAGLDIEYRFLAIPDEWRAPVEGTFVKETMVSLAQLGYTMGTEPTSWLVVVPNPESPEE